MDPTLQQIATDISHIKLFMFVGAWLLLALCLVAGFIVTLVAKGAKAAEINNSRRVFQEQAGALLQTGKHDELKKLTAERLAEAPGDEWAHYYAATAHYRTNSPVEAKKHFLRAAELSPILRRQCEASVEDIEAALAANKPKSVK